MMNKARIESLADEAWEYADSNSTDGDDKHGRLYRDKFAELIAAECARICKEHGETYEYSLTPAKARIASNASNYCAKLIKFHFGVK